MGRENRRAAFSVRQAIISAAVAVSAGVCAPTAFGQYYISDLGSNFQAPTSMAPIDGSMLLEDTSGNEYAIALPLVANGTYPTPTPTNQLANANIYNPQGNPISFTPNTVTTVNVMGDVFGQEVPDIEKGTNLVGTFTATDGTTHVFMYRNTVVDGQSPPTQDQFTGFQDLGSLPGYQSDTLTVTGIDPFGTGEIVGVATDAQGNKASFVKRLGQQSISVYSTSPNLIPIGISDNHIVSIANIGGVEHGYFQSTDVGTLGGGTLSGGGTYISAIDYESSFTGASYTANGDQHAFLGMSNEDSPLPLIDLGTLGGANSFGNAIAFGANPTATIIVGASATASGAFHAFMDENGGTMIDLNSLLSPADQAKWVLTDATTVDEQGDIGGVGLLNGVQHAFVFSLQQLLQPPSGSGSPPPGLSLTVNAPTKALTTAANLNAVPVTVGVQGGAGVSLAATYTLQASGSPAMLFNDTGTSLSNPTTLFSTSQADSHAAQLDLSTTASTYNGSVTFHDQGGGNVDVTTNFSVQMVQPANINAFTNPDGQGNLTSIVLQKSNPNPAMPMADAEVTSIYVPAGWSQVGTNLQVGATITDTSNIQESFAFNTAGVTNGLQQAVVYVGLQNDQTIYGATANDLGTQGFYLSYNVTNVSLPAGHSYGGLGNNASTFGYGTNAQLLDGAVGNNKTGTPGTGAPTINVIFNPSNPNIYSDIVSLSETNNDIVVLEVSYDPFALPAGLDPTTLVLLWDSSGNAFVGTNGVNAVLGNIYPNPDSDPLAGMLSSAVLGAYDPTLDFHLGWYGVDTTNDVVWAVIDHNSEFAVGTVPEPGALAALALVLCIAPSCRRYI